MAKQYWLQYHDFEKNHYPPSFCGINTNKSKFLSEMRWGKDVVLLMIGLKPTINNLLDCGFPLSIINQINTNQRLYMFWEKFTAQRYEYIGQKQFGGFDYEIYGDENDYVDFRNRPIILQSPEFKDFWKSYNSHGFIRLSDCGGVPFPELAEIGEGLVYRPSRVSNLPGLVSSGKVTVSQDVWRGLKFLQEKLPRNQLCNRSEAIKLLKKYGHQAAANWATSHPQDYLLAWKHGFEVQSEV